MCCWTPLANVADGKLLRHFLKNVLPNNTRNFTKMEGNFEAGTSQLQEIENVRDCPSVPNFFRSKQNGKSPASCSNPFRGSDFQTFQTPSGKDFPPLFEGESDWSRELRANAFREIWGKLSQEFDRIQPETNRAVFDRIERFGWEKHKKKWGETQIPAAVVFSGGVNPADHAHTFLALKNSLKNKGFFVALLRGRDLTVKRGVAGLISAVLREFSGLDTEGDDTVALKSWYDDVIAREGGVTGSQGESKERSSTPKGSSSEILSFNGESKSCLRVTRQTSARIAQGNTESVCGNKNANNSISEGVSVAPSSRPLVIIIDDGEAVEPNALRDLILSLGDLRLEVPVSLVISMSTNTETLQRFLPADAAQRLCCENFALVPSRQCIDEAFRRVLFSTDAPFFAISDDFCQTLDDQYLFHDFTVEAFKQGLLLAFANHFYTKPLSGLLHLLVQPATDVALFGEKCDDLPRELLDHAKDTFGVENDCEVSEVVLKAVERVAGWRLGLGWINVCAAALGGVAGSSGCTWRELYRSGVGAGFKESSAVKQLKQMSRSDRLPGMSTDQLLSLIKELTNMTEGSLFMCPKLQPILKSLQHLQKELQNESPHSSRRQSGQARQEGGQMQQRRGATVARFIQNTVWELCSVWDESAPGMEVFCLEGGEMVKASMLGAPRLAVHNSLATPECYFRKCSLKRPKSAVHKDDTCIAYDIYENIGGDCMNLAEWFVSFCRRHGVELDASDSDCPAELVPKSKADCKELFARFECALSELQFLGIIRPHKRRVGEHVKCLVFND